MTAWQTQTPQLARKLLPCRMNQRIRTAKEEPKAIGMSEKACYSRKSEDHLRDYYLDLKGLLEVKLVCLKVKAVVGTEVTSAPVGSLKAIK